MWPIYSTQADRQSRHLVRRAIQQTTEFRIGMDFGPYTRPVGFGFVEGAPRERVYRRFAEYGVLRVKEVKT